MSKKIISAVIPCRTQEGKIGETIDHIIKTAKTIKDFDIEIVFVNDRSDDRSLEVATKALEKYPLKQILNTDKSYVGNGKGMAVELGMTKAKGDYRLFMDADNSTKFEEIAKLIPYFDKYDIVLGTRYSESVVIPAGNWFKSFWLAIVDVIQVIIYGHAKRYTARTKQGRLRELVSRGGNLAFTVLLGQSFTDSRCGFKMYSKAAAEKIFPLCRIKTWDFDSEALVLAKRFGFSMVEVPVVWYDDAGASNFELKDMVNAFKAIFLIRWNQILGRYGKPAQKKGRLTKIMLVVLAFVLAHGVFNTIACNSGSTGEKEYALGRSAVYILGIKECKYSKYKKTAVREIKELPRDKSFEIVSSKINQKLEDEIIKYFPSFERFSAGSGGESFYIYSVKCNCGVAK